MSVGTRTTIKVTQDTPFSLVYGTEAVIPAEIEMPTIRIVEINIATNDDERRIDLDILEERREQAAIREEKAKLKMKGYYDTKKAGDQSGKGSYEVTKQLGKEHTIVDHDGVDLPPRISGHLKKC
ncbi:hypothetical protein Tco_0600180 [Tanacetum coccineum]|uniref:Reverse transcriptase domain-containing protein n=1 Tax=Tanacetum coccineum TaxID=301880 RepID=A0ABQ4WB34_9ASTR